MYTFQHTELNTRQARVDEVMQGNDTMHTRPAYGQLKVAESSTNSSVVRKKRKSLTTAIDNTAILTEGLTVLNISSPKKTSSPTSRSTHLCKELKYLSTEELTNLFHSQDEEGDNLLMIAIIEREKELAVTLIDLVPACELLDVKNHLGQSALHLTVSTSQTKLTRRLVLAGADLLSLDRAGNTPLHVACLNKDLDSAIALTRIISALECPSTETRHSLKVPQPDGIYNVKGQTCIHIAAEQNDTEMVIYLIDCRYSAHVNSAERLAGKTVLHLAAERNNKALVRWLLAHEDTDKDLKTYAGYTALDLTLGREHRKIVRLLEKAGAKTTLTESDSDDGDEDNMEDEMSSPLDDIYFSITPRRTKYIRIEYDDMCIGGTSIQKWTSTQRL